MIVTGENRSTAGNTCPSAAMSHGPIWDRTRSFAVRGRRLTSSRIVRLTPYEEHCALQTLYQAANAVGRRLAHCTGNAAIPDVTAGAAHVCRRIMLVRIDCQVYQPAEIHRSLSRLFLFLTPGFLNGERHFRRRSSGMTPRTFVAGGWQTLRENLSAPSHVRPDTLHMTKNARQDIEIFWTIRYGAVSLTCVRR